MIGFKRTPIVARPAPRPTVARWSPFTQEATEGRPRPRPQWSPRRPPAPPVVQPPTVTSSTTAPPITAPPPPPTEAPPPAGLSWRLGIQYAELIAAKSVPFSAAEVIRQCDAAAATPLHPSYAPHVHAGVAALLDRIRMMMEGAGDKPAALAAYVNVEPALLPSVIALLHHVGADDWVLQLGEDALRLDGLDLRRNVALSLALTHSRLADMAPSRAKAYERLQRARGVLSRVGDPFPEVARSLLQRCAIMQPLYVLELLQSEGHGVDDEALQGPTASERRAGAIAMLKGLLLQQGNALLAPPLDEGFALSALCCLSADEVTGLLNWSLVCGSQFQWATPRVLRHAAIAHLAAGVAHRRPSLLRGALMLLDTVGKTMDVFPERLCTHLLLAEGSRCRQLLQREYVRTRLLAGYLASVSPSNPQQQGGGLAYEDGKTATMPARDKIVDFVRFESRDGDWNVVPGLCLFTELWMNSVALPTFPELTLEGAGDALRARLHRLQQQLAPIRFSAHNPLAGVDAWGMVVACMAALTALPATLFKGAAAWLAVVSTRTSRAIQSIKLPSMMVVRRVALAIAFVATCAAMRHVQLPKTLPTPPALAALLPAGPVPRTQQFLDHRTAERLVRSWQVAKAQVLGKHRKLGLLRAVAVDPLASSMAANTAANAYKGWYFDYKLLDCKVTRVEHAVLRDGAIRVVATVHERCDMRGADGRRASSYRDRYAVEYKVVPWDDGTWRVKAFQVL